MSTPVRETHQAKAFRLSGSTMVGNETSIVPPGAPPPPSPAELARKRLARGVAHFARVFRDPISSLEGFPLVEHDAEGGRPDLHPGDDRTPVLEEFLLTKDTARDGYRIELAFSRRLTASERAAIAGTLSETAARNPIDPSDPGPAPIFPLSRADRRTLESLLPEASAEWERLTPSHDPSGFSVTYRSKTPDADRGPAFLQKLPGNPVGGRTITISVHALEPEEAGLVARSIAKADPLDENGGRISHAGRDVLLESHGQERKATVPGWRARFHLAHRVHVAVSLSASLDRTPLLDFLARWELARVEAFFGQTGT